MPEASSESSITGPFTIKKKSGRQNAQHDRGGLQSALGVSRPLASGLHRPPPIETKKKKAKRRKENANAALERLEQRTSHGRRYRVFLPSFFFLCLVSFGGNVRTELPPRVSMGRYGVLMVSDRVIYVLRLCVCVCVCVCVGVCVCGCVCAANFVSRVSIGRWLDSNAFWNGIKMPVAMKATTLDRHKTFGSKQLHFDKNVVQHRFQQ